MAKTDTYNILIQVRGDADKKLSKLSAEFDNGADRASKFQSALGAIGAVAGTAALAGVAALTTGVVGATKAAFDQVRQVEQATVALKAYEKDGSKVSQTLKELISYARSDLGVLFQRQDLFGAAQGLRIMGAETENLTDYVKIMSRSVGLGLSTWDGLGNVIQRVGSTGKLYADDLQFLQNAGFRLDSSLSGTTQTFESLFALLDKGIPANALNGQAQTIEGRFIRLQSAFRDVGASILGVDKETSKFIKGGLGDRFVKGVDTATQSLKNMVPAARAAAEGALDFFDNVNATIDLLATGDFKNGLFSAGIKEDSALVDVILSIREAFVSAWNFMKPALDELWSVVTKELVPAFQDLWKEIGPTVLQGLKLLAIVVGVTLVAQLWIFTKAVTAVTKTTAAFAQRVADTITWVRDTYISVSEAIVQAWTNVVIFFQSIPGFFQQLWNDIVLGVQNGVLAVANWFQELPFRIAFYLGVITGSLVKFATVDIPNFVNSTIEWFNSLPGKIGAALALAWIAVRDYFNRSRDDAVNSTTSLVTTVAAWFQSLPGKVGSAASSLWQGAKSAFSSFKNSVFKWANDTINSIVGAFSELPGKIGSAIGGAIEGAKQNIGNFFGDIGNAFSQGFNIGAFANGTNYAPGGPALVGEEGPEIVNLPRGSQVITADRTERMLSGGGTSVNVGQVIINDGRDVRMFFNDLAFELEARS
jgi:phage-related protein